MHTCVYLYTECTQTYTHAHVCHAKGRNDDLITSRPSASNMGPTAEFGLRRRIFVDEDSYISGALMGCQELVNVLQVPYLVDVVAPHTDPLYQQGTHLQLSWVLPHNGSQPSGGTNAVTLFTLQSIAPQPVGSEGMNCREAGCRLAFPSPSTAPPGRHDCRSQGQVGPWLVPASRTNGPGNPAACRTRPGRPTLAAHGSAPTAGSIGG